MSPGVLAQSPGRPAVSVVVLSYNRPHLLARALASITNQEYANLEILVVDNRSAASDQVAALVRQFPLVQLLLQPTNTGFATGMNIGLRAARGDFIHLTEDDILLESGFYEALIGPAVKRPGDLFSGIIHEDAGDQSLFAGVHLQIDRRFVYDAFPPPQPQQTDPYVVGMLIGCMIFGGRAAFDAVGFFRDEFFVYFEDAEFCWRARKAGVTLWVVPAARGRHIGTATGGPSPFIEFHKLKNYLATNLLYMPMTAVLPLTVKFFGYTSVRIAIKTKNPMLLLRIWAWALANGVRYIRERAKIG